MATGEYKLPFTGEKIIEKLNKIEDIEIVSEEIKNISKLLNTGIWYAICDTSESIAEKIVTTTTNNFTLTIGNIVYILFTNSNSIDTSLNIDGTGAIPIKIYSSEPTVLQQWHSGEIIGFIYDGTNFKMINGGIASTDYYGMTKLSNETNSTSTNLAATPYAVKITYDLANQAIPKPIEASNGDILIYDEETSAWIAAPAPSGNKLMRGPILITETQTLDLSKWGIQIGDPINVICVGGGGGGGVAQYGTVSGAGAFNNGYGAGASGGASAYGSSKYYAAGGGGGSGYVNYKSMIVDKLNIAITIGTAGKNGTSGYSSTSDCRGSNGGATSFGSYLSAAGGYGGYGGTDYSSSSSASNTGGKGGAGGNNGQQGTSGSGSRQPGGAGGIGFVPKGAFSVENGDTSGIYSGSGCVMIWY